MFRDDDQTKNIKITKNQINQKGLNLSEVEKTEKDKEENLVKKTCRELGITQKELAERTKFKAQTIRNWSSTGELPDYAKVFFDLMIKFNHQQQIINNFKKFNESVFAMTY